MGRAHTRAVRATIALPSLTLCRLHAVRAAPCRWRAPSCRCVGAAMIGLAGAHVKPGALAHGRAHDGLHRLQTMADGVCHLIKVVKDGVVSMVAVIVKTANDFANYTKWRVVTPCPRRLGAMRVPTLGQHENAPSGLPLPPTQAGQHDQMRCGLAHQLARVHVQPGRLCEVRGPPQEHVRRRTGEQHQRLHWRTA